MKTTKMSSGRGMGMSSDLHAGLVNKSPKAPSETPKGPSVDSDSTRSSVAKTPSTIGGRCA